MKRCLSFLLIAVIVISSIPLAAVKTNAACPLPHPDYPAGKWFGMGECWNFANIIYESYWGYRFDNKHDSWDNLIRNVPIDEANRRATAANLKKYISECPIGSCVRISRTMDYIYSHDGDLGHSFIVVSRDANGFTCYDIMGGNVCLNYRTYDFYANYIYLSGGLPVGNAYIKYVKAGSSTPTPSLTVTKTVYCKWRVGIPANFRLPLYDDKAGTTVNRGIPANSSAYTITCDEKVTLSDGSTRYHFVSGDGYSVYFTFNPSTMTVEQRHNWSDWTVTKKATCSQTGLEKRTCTCGAEETYTLSKKSHSYSSANCTTPKTCSVCGATSGNALGHKYDSVCDEYCNVCSQSRAVTHTFERLYDAENHYDKCTVCGKITGKESHEFTQLFSTKCEGCGYTKFVLCHKYDNDCDSICNICGDMRAITHSFTDYVYNDDATTEADGTKTRSCYVCNYRETIIAEGTKKSVSKLDEPARYVDVKVGSWFKESVDYAVSFGLFVGTSDNTFSPSLDMTRAQFVQVFANLTGVDTTNNNVNSGFTDVPRDKWYTAAVTWAADNGIVAGIGDGKFDPDAKVTREQMCVMMVNYIENYRKTWLVEWHDVPVYADDSEISSWARDAVYKCSRGDLVNGIGNNMFAPKATASRAEGVTIFSTFHMLFVRR